METAVARGSGLIGALEAGGTKFRVAVFSDQLEPVEEDRFPTTTVDETLGRVEEFMAPYDISALGVASFGPLDLRQGSPTYGSITATPKPGWSNTPLLPRLLRTLGVPGEIDTDVGAALLAELRFGVGRGRDPVAYVTVGTGIGGAVSVRGEVLRGRGHPEMGHIPVARCADDDFGGSCPFHGACLEGLASGTAVQQRWGSLAHDLQNRSEVWDLEAAYLAQLVRTLAYVVVPERIILGGGLIQREGLLDKIRIQAMADSAGYSTDIGTLEAAVDYIVDAGLGQDAGLIGAAIIARRLLGEDPGH